MFQDKPNEEILDQAEAALDECLKQSGRISDITKKLANFAKPSTEFRPELITVSAQINEALAMVSHDLELERIKIKKVISDEPSKILADKHEIQQIFFNIIRNAGQAIVGPGTITIRVLSDGSDKVHIEIEDTGEGIPGDKINRIFEPFFTTRGLNKGAGLGLSIVRQLVWKNKGEISFRSQVGVGTTFTLEFPKAIK
jgi:signal transduction histidine kinase